MLNNEVWKDIQGYENIYQVSNKGNVRSLDRIDIIKDGRKFVRTGKVLKAKICRKGYHRVQLCINSKCKHCNIHRLVAIAFIPTTNYNLQVNHIDGDKTNNYVSNLEWVTNSENFNHAMKNNLLNLTSKSKVVRQYTLDGVFIKEYPSTLQVERELGFTHSGIGMCARGLYKQSQGFIWRYRDD